MRPSYALLEERVQALEASRPAEPDEGSIADMFPWWWFVLVGVLIGLWLAGRE